jgi:hypothetical protein
LLWAIWRDPAEAFLFTLIAAMFLICGVALAQTPPTATEAFNLRIKCKELAEQKLDKLSFHPLSVADGDSIGMSANTIAAINGNAPEVIDAWQTSKYDPENNRCYVQIYKHTFVREPPFDRELLDLYDAQTDSLLAFANIENGKKVGMVFNKKQRKTASKNRGWDDAVAYMDEMLAGNRK